MPERSPYRAFVAGFARLIADAAALQPQHINHLSQSPLANDVPKVLLFSPHPDDECLTGALPLRLRRERAMNVINVAVTLGSNRARRRQRWIELTEACASLGFGLRATTAEGLDRINPETREADPQAWCAAVDLITTILAAEQPRIVFAPHCGDRHPTHVGTHHLVFDALARLEGPAPQWIVETEYWGSLQAPNLMVGSSIDDVADLVAALACHRGEVARNPYHLALPATMIDAARRGAECVDLGGGATAACRFSTLYRVSRRTRRGTIEVCGKSVLTAEADASDLFGC